MVKFENKSGEPVEQIVLLLSTIEEAPKGTDLAKYLKLEPIYFDFDKWNIRADAAVGLKKVIAYLNEYPNQKIQIGSHTDSRASKAYNIRLSDKRAQSTMTYIIEKGINANRLSALGLGESILTNNCSDYVKCKEGEHQANRRSEFIIVD